MDLFEGTNNVIHVVATAEKHRLSKPDGLLATNQVAVGATDLTIIESVAHVVQIRTEGFVLKQGLMVQRVSVTGRARNSLGMERGDHGCARNTKRLAVEPQDLREVPLASVLGRITESLEMPIFYDSAKMASESGFPQDIKITLQYRGNPRTFLDRLLEPYSLTYVINESGIEITTTSWAAIKPSLVVYDLSFLFPDSQNIKSLVGAIEFIVDPTESSSDPYISFVLLVDSRLIVATNERVHVEIDSLLVSLAPTTSTSAASVLESGNKMAPNDKKPDAIDPLRGSNSSSDDPFAF
ncbi:MAG: hypothetical protein ACK506_07950 [Pirellula sp.]|jgi:hypothetical protein